MSVVSSFDRLGTSDSAGLSPGGQSFTDLLDSMDDGNGSQPSVQQVAARPRQSAPQQSHSGFGIMDAVHGVLTAGSFLPSVFGSAASYLDAGVYAAQGDWTNAGISAGAATVGLVSDAGGAKLAAMGIKEGVAMLKGGEEAANVAKGTSKLVEEGSALAKTGKLGTDAAEAATKDGVKAGQNVTGKSQELYDQLPARLRSKTVATDGDAKTISGYGASTPEGYTHVEPSKVIDRAAETGHDLKPAGAMDQGVPGKYNASHAEKQAIVNNPAADHVDVSRPMCQDCQGFYKAEAAKQGRSITVSDPEATRVFHPNGEVDVTPRK